MKIGQYLENIRTKFCGLLFWTTLSIVVFLLSMHTAMEANEAGRFTCMLV